MSDDTPTLSEPKADAAYRVLARKYRPTTFAEMIGQDALVRTLSNAIASGRLAHAFVLTGVRGVGKTTRSEEHTSELQSLMRISYAVFCLKKKNKHKQNTTTNTTKCYTTSQTALLKHVDITQD